MQIFGLCLPMAWTPSITQRCSIRVDAYRSNESVVGAAVLCLFRVPINKEENSIFVREMDSQRVLSSLDLVSSAIASDLRVERHYD